MAAEYYRPLPYLSENRVLRFWRTVQVLGPDECWPWLGNCDGEGYGKVSINYRSYKAHRIAFFLANSIDPGALMVLHSCDNKPCCNPRHLSRGTNADNQKESYRKGKGNQGDNHWKRRHPERSASATLKRDYREMVASLAAAQFALQSQPELRARGERHGMAKFTQEQVEQMRREYEDASPKWGVLLRLAKQHRVGRHTIAAIVHGKRYVKPLPSPLDNWERWVEPGC